MNDTVPIKRSDRGMKIQIALTAVVAFLIGLFVSWVFHQLLGWSEGGGVVLQALTWIFLIVAWLISSIKLWYDWSIKKYEISNEALIIHSRLGLLGSIKTVYRYESIISLRMTQGFLGKRYGYGDIHITIPKIEDEVVMNDVENPQYQLVELQNRIGAGRTSGTATALVS